MKKSGGAKRHQMIYGTHAVREALVAGQQMEKIMLRKDVSPSVRTPIMELAKKAGVPVQFVPDEKLYKLSGTDNHQGVVAITALVYYRDLEEVIVELQENEKPPCFLMLDGVTDVRNFGAIVRSAECMSVDAIILPSTGSASINADAIKSSAGAINHMTISKVPHLADAIFLLQSYDVRVLACYEGGNTIVSEAELDSPVCLIFGSEGKGISSRVIKLADDSVRIPLSGEINSLNVSVAAGMVMYEVSRQRQNN